MEVILPPEEFWMEVASFYPLPSGHKDFFQDISLREGAPIMDLALNYIRSSNPVLKDTLYHSAITLYRKTYF